MTCQIFSEFEAYEDAHKDVDIRLTLSHPDRPQWAIHHLGIDSLHLQIGSDGCGDVAEGATRRDGWIIYFQTSGKRGLVNGERLTSDAVAVVEPGAEFCLASQGCHDWTSVFFPTACLAPLLGTEQSGSAALLRVVRPGQVLVDRLQKTVCGFMAATIADPTVSTEAASITSFREQLCRIADRMIGKPTSASESNERSIDRRQLVQAAVQSVEEWPHMSPSVSELARNLDVSERTLRSAFAEYLGISPYHYLIAKRLNYARRLLLASAPDEITVRQAAAKVGFWDLGRFAKKHRRLFGELPSVTLQRQYAAT